MQGPTFSGLKVRSPRDAHILFHAVWLDKLPMIRRRLDSEERRQIRPGCVYVWEEKVAHSQSGIERWTDSVRWGPSRCRDEFLFYQEKADDSMDLDLSDSDPSGSPYNLDIGFVRGHLIKQTYSVFVNSAGGRRKWHLTAYFTQESLHTLRTVDEIPFLSQILVPEGMYKTARSAKGRGMPTQRMDTFIDKASNQQSYALYPSNKASRLVRIIPAQDGLSKPRQQLAPLVYLQTTPPHRRHPVDEEALMSFAPNLMS